MKHLWYFVVTYKESREHIAKLFYADYILNEFKYYNTIL